MKKLSLILLISLMVIELNAQEYCEAKVLYPHYMYISNVTFNTINNTTTYQQTYSDHTDISTNLTSGQEYTISITRGTGYDMDYYVWIDFNNDFNFTDDERVVSQDNNWTQPFTQSFTINIPEDAVPGSTRMRIAATYYSYGFNAGFSDGRPTISEYDNTLEEGCSHSSFPQGYLYGEVEDYTVNIVGDGGGSNNWPDASYTYDEAGNRMSRQILNISSISDEDSMLTQARSKNPSIKKSMITDAEWAVFPNPVSNRLYVENKSNKDIEYRAQLFDIGGKLIAEKSFIDVSIFNFSTLQSGVYILSVYFEGDGTAKNWKIIKE